MSILFDFHDDLVVEEMNFPWTDPSITAIKAGTPLDEDGAIANNGDAVGLVAYTLPHGGDNLLGVASSNADGSLYIKVKVIKSGYVNLAEAETSFGSALTDACKSALTGIHFITDVGGSGGGGALPEPTVEGDVLAVGKVADPSVVILPEQTVEYDESENGWVLTGGNPSLFEAGAKVCITVNGESEITVVEYDADNNRYFAYTKNEADCLNYYPEIPLWAYLSDVLSAEDPITISVVGVKNAWVETTEIPYSGYDVVILIKNNEISVFDAQILKGNLDDVIDAVANRSGIIRTYIGMYSDYSASSYYDQLYQIRYTLLEGLDSQITISARNITTGIEFHYLWNASGLARQS